MSDYVSAEDVMRVVEEQGSAAKLEDDMLHIYPKNGAPGSEAVYRVPTTGFGRRIVSQIAHKCGISTHLFWERPRVSLAVKKPA